MSQHRFLQLLLAFFLLFTSCKTDQVVSKSPFQQRKYNKGIHVNLDFSRFRKAPDLENHAAITAADSTDKSKYKKAPRVAENELPVEHKSLIDLGREKRPLIDNPQSIKELIQQRRVARAVLRKEVQQRLTPHQNLSDEEGETETKTPRTVPTLAALGVITGLLSLLIAGLILGAITLVFGVIAINRIEKYPEKYKGRGIAVVALLLGMAGFFGALIFIALMA